MRRIQEKWRKALLGGGVLLLLSAVLADPLGLSSPGFSAGQLLGVGMGSALALIGFLGRRFVRVYKGLALILLNTLVLLLGIEMACGIYLKMTTGSQQTRSRQTGSQETEGPMSVGRFANSYHKGQPWTGRYLKELAASPIEYAPFLIWRKQPFEGQLINIDSAGNRVTPGAVCREGSYNVFMLGGSTLWGWGSPDWGTIPAYLQKELQPYLDQPLCVVNMAEVGHVYTQELIMLQRQLQLGHIPDLVVVYNGGNEVITTYIHSRADVHYDFELIADIYNHRHDPARQKSFLSDLMTEHSYALQVFARIRRKLSPSGQGTSLIIERSEQNRDQLTTDLRLSYQANSKALQALSREYGFESAVFLQSSIWTAGKKMTDEELTAPLKEVSTMGHMLKSLQTVQVDHFYDFSRVLDDTEKTVYIDALHITPEGNARVAQKMVETLVQQLGLSRRDLKRTPSSKPVSKTDH